MQVRRQSKQRHDMIGVSICKTYGCANVALSFNPLLLLLLWLLRGLLWFSCCLLYQSAKPNPKLSKKHSIDHCSCKIWKKTCFSVFLIFEWQFTCLPSSPELRSSMQHSVPYNNLKKINGWCKQILPKLMLRIYSIMYLQISFLHIPGIPEVILSLRILWTPKTTVWKVPHPSHHPCLLSSGPSHERTHPCECHHHHHPTNRRVPLLGGGFNPLKKY